MSTVTLSPIYAHFSETLAGLPTIHALRASRRFMNENEEKLTVNQRANFGSESAYMYMYIIVLEILPDVEGALTFMLIIFSPNCTSHPTFIYACLC